MEIEILQEDRLRAWGARIRMPAGAIDALAEMAQQITNDPALYNAFADFYTRTALQGSWHREWSDLPKDPAVVETLGDVRASLFYLLAYLAALPHVERVYRRLGIPLEVFDATMHDFSAWTEASHEVHGDWRFDQFSWMWRHVDGQLFRLGRLQFMLAPFEGGVTAFQHVDTGQVLLLGDPSMPLRADGYALKAGTTADEAGEAAGKAAEERPWFARLEESPAGWRGNPVAPQGYVLREERFLLRSRWKRALQTGDTILDLHIPAGTKLTTEDCRASFEAAYRFFQEFFPDRPFRGVSCHTWFFTPQLQQILPEDSNIVQFQREFTLFPHPGSAAFLWSFVFGERFRTPDSAPRDTALRRAVLEWIEQGGELFDLPGVRLHPPSTWGTQPDYPEPVEMRTLAVDAVRAYSEEDEDEEEDYGDEE